MKNKNSNPIIFELSREIGNKHGGIYTVIQTKVSYIQEKFPNYFVVGSFHKETQEFIPLPVPFALKKCFQSLLNKGIICSFGKWNVKGKPLAFQIKVKPEKLSIQDVDSFIRKKYEISLLTGISYYDDSIVRSFAWGLFLEEISKTEIFGKSRIIAHFHESYDAVGMLYLRAVKSSIITVFTTHATHLGRAQASFQAEDPEYRKLSLAETIQKIRSSSKSYQLVLHNLCITCAKTAHIFTTTSTLLARECEKFLGKSPDFLTRNGINNHKNRFKSLKSILRRSQESRKKIKKFLELFFPMKKQNIFFLTSARYEIFTKGFDVFSKALIKLERQLQVEKFPGAVFAFICIIFGDKPAEIKILEKFDRFFCKNNFLQKVQKALALSAETKILDPFKKLNEEKIISVLKSKGLTNSSWNKVKIVFYPTSASKKFMIPNIFNLLKMNYLEMVAGMDSGIFPSFYEPWGYTPLEAASNGVLTVTTERTGFAEFIADKQPKRQEGIWVLKIGKNKAETANNLFKIFLKIIQMNSVEKKQRQWNAYKTSLLCSWQEFIKDYQKVYEYAQKI